MPRKHMSSDPTEPFLFYGGWPSSFTCDSRIIGKHPFIRGVTSFQTPEHLFQAYKAINLEEFEIVRRAPSPGGAKRRGREIILRIDWNHKGESGEPICHEVMLYAHQLKYAQPRHRDQLLGTGDRILVEDAIDQAGRPDSIWGARVLGGYSFPGPQGNHVGWGGSNRLGFVLMQIRAELRGESWSKTEWMERYLNMCSEFNTEDLDKAVRAHADR